MRIVMAAAVNEPDTLAQCLSRSPDVVSGALPLRTYTGYTTAGSAYNAALTDAPDADFVVFVHQDVYLPSGSLSQLIDQLRLLTEIAPDWALAGVIGGTAEGRLVGQTWCSGHGKLLGARCAAPLPVVTLDEMLLIMRTSSGLRFDENLPSFHLYGADMLLAACSHKFTSWVIDLPAIHHSKPVISLGGAYCQSYRYIRRKWRSELPVFNLVCPLERGMWRFWLTEARLRWKHRRLRVRPSAQGDPVVIAYHIGYER